MSEAKEYRISNLSVDKNGWMHVVLSRGDDSVIDDAYIKLVEYSALAAKDAEIEELRFKLDTYHANESKDAVRLWNENEQLKKRISWLESGSIHTCHAECEKPLCVANREIEKLKVGLDNTLKCAEHVENQRKHLKQALDVAKVALHRIHYNNYRGINQYEEIKITAGEALQKINTLTEGE